MWGEILKQIEMIEKKVVSRGGGYDVVHCHGEDKGKSLGHHDTKEEAMAQHRAIEASKHAKKSIDDYLEKNGAKEPSKPAPSHPGFSTNGHERIMPSRVKPSAVLKPIEPSAPEPIASMKKDMASMIKEYLDKQLPSAANIPMQPKTPKARAEAGPPESSGSNLPHPTAHRTYPHLEAAAKKPVEATAKPQTPPKPRGGDTRTRAEKYQVMPKWAREILD